MRSMPSKSTSPGRLVSAISWHRRMVEHGPEHA
jgi:hypothetical protein